MVMKKNFLLSFWLLLLLLCSQTFTHCHNAGQTAGNGASTPTVVYLVRHAEKQTLDPNDEDPDLTDAGYQRSNDLLTYLEAEPIDALYSTKYRRNRLTLTPLAQARGLQIRTYEAHDFENFVNQLIREHAGQTVVVAAHTNTLLELIKTFGAPPPLEKIPDHAYDYLFRVQKVGDQPATVEVLQFGQPTEEPVSLR
jgi:2,3-bisphosphoglycerate-dependent phosphoglycerate mutase